MSIHKFYYVVLLVLMTACEKHSPDCKDVLNVRLDNLNRMEDRENRKAEILWTHWHRRECATLNFIAVSKEGKASHMQYNITLIPPSTMMLKRTVVRDRYGYQGQVIPREDPEAGFDAYTIERIASENPNLDWKSARVFRDDEVVPPSKYWLRFRGWEGYPISYF